MSDRLKPTSGELKVCALRLDGGGIVKEFTRKVTVPANTSTVVWKETVDKLLDGANKEDVVIHVSYKDKTGKEYTNNYFLAKQKDMHYVTARINKDFVAVEGGYDVTLSCDVFARGVFLSLKGDIDNFISDNYMDILPGKPVTVRVTTDLPGLQFAERLQVTSFLDAVEL